MKTKKVVIVADFHVGSRAGLTNDPGNNLQRELFSLYKDGIKSIGKPDIVIANGDLIDGARRDNTRTEQDPGRQAKIAAELLKMWDARKYYLTYGTAYHVTSKMDGVDYENCICDLLNQWKPRCAHIRDYYDNLSINGVIFNVKHKVGTSSIPHGRATALLREEVWNYVSTIRGHRVMGNIFIRSHAHYYLAIDDGCSELVITPALQGADTIFGNRICSADIDVGFVTYEIKGPKKWQRKKELFSLQSAKPLLFEE